MMPHSMRVDEPAPNLLFIAGRYVYVGSRQTTLCLLKVSKSQKQILKFSFEPKKTRKICWISALCTVKTLRAEILQIFWVIFGSNENFKICFRDLLTFNSITICKMKSSNFCVIPNIHRTSEISNQSRNY